MPWLPVLFIVIPITELFILLEVGQNLGVFPTLVLIVSTAFVGFRLFRAQGIKTWLAAQQKLAQGELPSREILEGAVILFSAALMITPGLLTDTVGLFCLVPLTRKWLLTYLEKHFSGRFVAQSASFNSRNNSDNSNLDAGRVIDGEYQEQENPEKNRTY